MTGRRGVGIGDRGRVPFALVGVLLVVTSALYAGAIGSSRDPSEPAVDVAVERTTADARAAFRAAVAEAGVAAASDPILTPANNSWGEVIGDDEPFRDALEIRVYLTARERFESLGRSHRGAEATASLEATPTPEALERAKERVRVEQVGPDGEKLRAVLSNVTVAVTRSGRVVGRENVSLSVVVSTPVLAVHDRVQAFQERLNAGLRDPGFGQRLSARLYAVAWARGYAQYGGAPIANVVANRHVELMTNGALLDVQRATFGQSDPDGRRALGAATATVGLQDGLAAHGPSDPETAGFLDEQLRSAREPTERAGVPRLADAESEAPSADDAVDVEVGLSADYAFRGLSRLDGLERTIQSVYGASARPVAATRTISGGEPEGRTNGTAFRRANRTTTRVVDVSRANDGPDVRTPAGHHRLGTYRRTVTLRHQRQTVRAADGAVDTGYETATERKRVTVAVVGRHADSEYAPDNPIRPVHERGGPFDGPNLENVTERAEATVLDRSGGVDGLASRAARGTLDAEPVAIDAEWPDAVRQWIAEDLTALHDRVRNVSVSVPRAELGTYEAEPARRLAERLRANRSALVDAPSVYDGVASKARAAARGQFLDRVVGSLRERARGQTDREESVKSGLESNGVASLSLVRQSYDASRANATDDASTGDLALHVDGAPPYLTTSGIEHDDVTAVEPGTTVHPMVAENVNYATIPYADVTDSILGEILPSEAGNETQLETAATQLRAVDRAIEQTGDESLERSRAKLRRTIRLRLTAIETDLRTALGGQRIGDSRRQRRRIVSDGLSQWNDLDGKALAMSNASVVDAIVAAAEDRASDDVANETARDRLRIALRVQIYDSLRSSETTVSGPLVESASARVESAVGERLREGIDGASRRRYGKTVSRLPSGFPITPVPGYWVATGSVWSVTVRGRYERFAVETPRRTPAAGDASLSYVRDGSDVGLDVDGDGRRERLGSARRVSFSARTAVVVVVPAGGSGVGDVDGTASEQSAGWPRPGPDDPTPSTAEDAVEGGGISPDRSDRPGAEPGAGSRPPSRLAPADDVAGTVAGDSPTVPPPGR